MQAADRGRLVIAFMTGGELAANTDVEVAPRAAARGRRFLGAQLGNASLELGDRRQDVPLGGRFARRCSLMAMRSASLVDQHKQAAFARDEPVAALEPPREL